MNPNIEGHVIYPSSVTHLDDTSYLLVRDVDSGEKRLCVLGNTEGFDGKITGQNHMMLCPLTPENSTALRNKLVWLKPAPLGLSTSAGFGDRLGLATPGHIRAVRNSRIQPVFAQQSVRENARTGRTPVQVLDDAMWGVFQEGWRMPWGADADHIKTIESMDAFFDAGYTFFTLDPGEYVDNAASIDGVSDLQKKVTALPWAELGASPGKIYGQLLGWSFQMPGFILEFDETQLLRAMAKYGRALAHVLALYRHLEERMGDRPFDLEISVDETQTPTTVHEHFYITSELRRLGINWTSLAPRFVGKFEKGVDYIGNLADFEAELARHVDVAQYFDNYKLSLHSGSDKFSIYPLLAYHTNNRVHLKTAGTSYLEALKVVAQLDTALFSSIVEYARAHYETDRASYHVSADLNRLAGDVSPALLDQFDGRQVLHVTFGSVLDKYGEQIKTVLADNEELYYSTLEQHFKKHLKPFVSSTK